VLSTLREYQDIRESVASGAGRPASAATSARKSRVAPTPMGTVVVCGWPRLRFSQPADSPAISGYSTTLKSPSPMRAKSDGRAPSGATTFTSTPRPASSPRTSAMSSRWRKPSEHGPRMLQRGGPGLRSIFTAKRRMSWYSVSAAPQFSFF
jgi:hypothetical protein